MKGENQSLKSKIILSLPELTSRKTGRNKYFLPFFVVQTERHQRTRKALRAALRQALLWRGTRLSELQGKLTPQFVKHLRLHDARHTHASLMLKAKEHPKIVQERLGHANISTTLDLYSPVTPGLQQAAA
jgi:integrase